MRKQNFVMPEFAYVSWFFKYRFINPTILNIGNLISQYVPYFKDVTPTLASPPPSYASAFIQRVERIKKPEREDDSWCPPNAAATVFDIPQFPMLVRPSNNLTFSVTIRAEVLLEPFRAGKTLRSEV
jgi:hypothetical protein